MQRTGFAQLPLHQGRAPQWLVKRMIRLAEGIVEIIIDEHGHDVFLQRISDPYWFQALGCVLGYDWHSSGVTTVVTGVLKTAIRSKKLGLAVCGGKGKASTRALEEIGSASEEIGLGSDWVGRLQYASRISAKVDNAAIQAGYPLYHHAFFFTEEGKWAVVQQGMSAEDRTARRYHWLSDNVKDFVVEPHQSIVGDKKRKIALDMTSHESEGCRRASVEIAKEGPERITRLIGSVKPTCQKTLEQWIPSACSGLAHGFEAKFLSMPVTINWKALKEAYEFQPSSFEELLGIKGVGPSTVKGLALASELIYGEKPCWRDPVKYSFAFGGKDGVPYPVDRKAMDESIYMLSDAIENAHLGNRERLRLFERLKSFVPSNIKL